MGASRQLLIGALDRRFDALASVPLILEYEAVLTRVEQLEVIGMTSLEVNEILDAFVKVSGFRCLCGSRGVPTSEGHPGDEMVLETAVNGATDWLVTFNLRHLADAARDFGIRVARPGDVLREIRKHEKK